MLIKSRFLSADYSLYGSDYSSKPMACQDKSQKVHFWFWSAKKLEFSVKMFQNC